jgi:hypothetical protein
MGVLEGLPAGQDQSVDLLVNDEDLTLSAATFNHWFAYFPEMRARHTDPPWLLRRREGCAGFIRPSLVGLILRLQNCNTTLPVALL